MNRLPKSQREGHLQQGVRKAAYVVRASHILLVQKLRCELVQSQCELHNPNSTNYVAFNPDQKLTICLTVHLLLCPYKLNITMLDNNINNDIKQ